MDRHQVPADQPAPPTPAPGRAALLRHLRLVEAAQSVPRRTWRDVVGDDDWEGRSLDRLARFAGGVDALGSLDRAPLPASEPFDAVDIDRADLPAVQAVLAAVHDKRPPYIDALNKICGPYMPPWLQDEYITILHRLIARAARRGLTHWHRDPRRMAAAFVWIALGGNVALGRGGKVPAQDIWRWYAVNDCRALARRLCVDAKLGSLYPPDDDPMPLSDLHVVFGDVRVLHSSFRAYLIKQRDVYEQLIVDSDARRSSRRPVQMVGDGQLHFRGRHLRPLWAFKAPSTTGRASVMVAFGQSTDDDDYELVGLSVPDARLLLSLVQDAVDAPSTSGTMKGVRNEKSSS
ncbi:MAG: hypothetical protein ABI658_23955 [Acidimicrobiales bacterium]